jgi:hypothetical protein
MKRSAAVGIVGVILWTLASASLLAQAQPVAPSASAPPTAPVAASDVKMVAANAKGRHWLKADARVVKCSENYR